MASNHLLVLGYGYSARRIGESVLRMGWRVSGTRRSEEGCAELESAGLEAHLFDGTSPSDGVAEALRSATHLLVSTPPGDGGEPGLTHHRGDIRSAERLQWTGYLSTTGVYGDRGGDWVHESTPPDPGSPRTRRRLEAERGWADLAEEVGIPLHVFRLSGIYGPGRSALDRLRDGSARRIVAPELVFNRIHVDDIAGAVVAGMQHGPDASPVEVFNVSDDEPAPPSDVVAYAAGLLGVDPPPEIPLDEADLSPAALRFYTENKRVGNDRLASGLGYRLRYPTYREGLEAVLAAGR